MYMIVYIQFFWVFDEQEKTLDKDDAPTSANVPKVHLNIIGYTSITGEFAKQDIINT